MYIVISVNFGCTGNCPKTICKMDDDPSKWAGINVNPQRNKHFDRRCNWQICVMWSKTRLRITTLCSTQCSAQCVLLHTGVWTVDSVIVNLDNKCEISWKLIRSHIWQFKPWAQTWPMSSCPDMGIFCKGHVLMAVDMGIFWLSNNVRRPKIYFLLNTDATQWCHKVVIHPLKLF